MLNTWTPDSILCILVRNPHFTAPIGSVLDNQNPDDSSQVRNVFFWAVAKFSSLLAHHSWLLSQVLRFGDKGHRDQSSINTTLFWSQGIISKTFGNWFPVSLCVFANFLLPWLKIPKFYFIFNNKMPKEVNYVNPEVWGELSYGNWGLMLKLAWCFESKLYPLENMLINPT